MTHRNAPLTPEGRRRACLEVDRGRPICHVAAEFRMARQTLGKWHARWLEFGEEGLEDRSSRPLTSPNQTPIEIEDLIESLRREHKIGPVQLAGRLREAGHEVPVSTIHRVLVRRGINHLRAIAPDGQDLREPVTRYEWARPGDMIHVDVKKVGRIPDGGGWRVHGRGSAQGKAARTTRRLRLPALRHRRPLPVDLHRRTHRRARPDSSRILATSREVVPPARNPSHPPCAH